MSGYKRERVETKEWIYRKEDKQEGNRQRSEKTVKREEKEKRKDTAVGTADGQLNDKKRQTKEHLNKSDLTEEIGLVINPQISGNSSGSTQNSLYKERQTGSRSGNIIRIRLAKRYKENGQDTAGGIADGELNVKKGLAGESLEKSDLTDENRLTANSQNSCHSSDSTQNSLEKEGHTSITSGSTRHGPIIRIRLPLAKPKKEASLANVQNSSERMPLQEDCGLGASIKKERISSIGQPLSEHGQQPSLKRKRPEASIIEEEGSFMRLPHSKLRKLETSQRVEFCNTSMRVDLPAQKTIPRPDPEPLLKHRQLPPPKQPEGSIRREKSSIMRQPHSKFREPKTSVWEESCSISGRADLPAQKINPSNPPALSEHGQLPSLTRKQREASIIKKESSFMRLPHSKLREPEALRREESCSTSGRADLPAQKINPRPKPNPRPLSEHGPLPSLKREQPEASIRKEKSSFMRLPHSKLREPETPRREESCSTSVRAASPAKKINLRPDPQPLSEHGQLPSLKHKQAEASIIKEKRSSMRLPDSKLREPETSRRDESCSTSERAHSSGHKNSHRADQQLPLTTSAVTGIVGHDDDASKNKSSGSSVGIVAHDDARAKKGSNSKKQSVEELYEALVVNWVPPPLQPDLEEDLEWLFPKPGDDGHQSEQPGDNRKANLESEVKYDMYSRGWRMRWIPPKPDVVYALPYTIPY